MYTYTYTRETLEKERCTRGAEENFSTVKRVNCSGARCVLYTLRYLLMIFQELWYGGIAMSDGNYEGDLAIKGEIELNATITALSGIVR